MDPEVFARLRRKLGDERERLRRELSTTLDEPTYDDNITDDASETFEQERNLALERNLRHMLDAVERALQRMDNGQYGRCAECGKPIPAARLEAFPSAALCIECKGREERSR